MKRFYGFDREYILYRLPCIEGWAWYAWSIENNGIAPMELACDGYIAQEVERRRAARKH